ncbi:hypothetical protein [Halocalculus aciditolerans]|uniref:Uncharacterized protein n=1 Tax=Halocalculus aciditolerans TaxID=1383812 RepID=A0A830FBM0_9EURY|nr:hypothetical protein [Halocalculus aciditolerans]GGL73516.1 hypothetical protein GCM10009039_34520 [Halocalculus aciditolerans]
MVTKTTEATEASFDDLADLAGTGWHAAEVEILNEKLPLKRYTVDNATFVAGPRDDRPGREDNGDGRHLGTNSEGSSTTQRFDVDGKYLVETETDYQPGATSPRMRVSELEEGN